MRQRKVKNEQEKLAEHSLFLIEFPAKQRGKWQEVFGNENDVYAEFGCGKGQFILTLASQNPDRNYIAFEGSGTIVLRALQKAEERGLKNIFFTKEYVNDVSDYFEAGELAGIYLNFSDPWPKDRHAKRRLTHGRYLDGYKRILKEEGCIEFKTDNEKLFEFASEEFINNSMTILELTEDLHGTELPAKAATTEYEDKFRGEGKKIKYCKVQV